MATTKKGAISTPFKDAIFTPKGMASPAPAQANMPSGKK